jgi:ATP-dependent Clp protease protease subunit
MKTIWIDDVIGEDFFGEGITAATIREQLEGAAAGERILLRINSPGGLVFEAAAIRSVIADHAGPVDVQIDGLAASAASYIAMLGETITMTEGAMLMIHHPWSGVLGTAQDMRAEAELLDKIAENIAQSYATKCGCELPISLAAMADETWYTAEEAVAAGLADQVKQTQPAAPVLLRVPAAFGYQNAPAAVAIAGAEPLKIAVQRRKLQEAAGSARIPTHSARLKLALARMELSE